MMAESSLLLSSTKSSMVSSNGIERSHDAISPFVCSSVAILSVTLSALFRLCARDDDASLNDTVAVALQIVVN